jgi:ferredoxin
MKFEVKKEICAGCGACIQICPYGAIKIGKDGKAYIDQKKCKKCGKCQKICPLNAIKEIKNSKN